MKLLTLDKPSDYNQTYFDKSNFHYSWCFPIKRLWISQYGII